MYYYNYNESKFNGDTVYGTEPGVYEANACLLYTSHRYVAAMDVSHTSMAFLIVWAMRLRLEFLEEKEGTQQ